MKNLFMLSAFLIALSTTAWSQGNPYSCPGCNLAGQNFSGKDLTDANFSGAILTNANFSNAVIKGVVFTSAQLSSANFQGATIASGTFGPADFTNSNLTNANFTGANISNAIFNYTDMSGANFSKTDLTRAKFGPTMLFRTDSAKYKPKFHNAKLSCEFPWLWKNLDTKGATFPKCDNVPPAQEKTAPAPAPEKGRQSTDPLPTVATAKSKNYRVSFKHRRSLANFQQTIWVSASGGNDTVTCGDSLSPCASIAYGMGKVTSTPAAILVDYGVYNLTQSIQLADNVSLFGGYFDRQSTDYQSLVNAPANGVPAFTGNNIQTGLTMEGFFVHASNVAQGNTSSSIAVQIQSSTNIYFENVSVEAATGGIGSTGGGGSTGATGNNGSGTTGGASACGGYNAGGSGGGTNTITLSSSECCGCGFLCCDYCCSWSYTPISGGSGQPGTTGNWAAGSSSAGGVFYGCPDSERPSTAGNGTAGNAAGCGVAGSSSTNLSGNFSGTSWQPSVGGAGTGGGNGGGGGGGGNGGPCGYTTCWANCEGYNGTAGGGGGAGGCGGSAGQGGTQGGASFGIVLISSSVTCGDSVKVVGGAGGAGGTGGAGASGGAGGTGAAASPANDVCNDTGGQGGGGGNGGAGGAGAGGAGGNGGPSVCLALVQSSTVTGTPSLYIGISGAVGTGGAGGANITGGSCTGPNGNNGVAGLVATQNNY